VALVAVALISTCSTAETDTCDPYNLPPIDEADHIENCHDAWNDSETYQDLETSYKDAHNEHDEKSIAEAALRVFYNHYDWPPTQEWETDMAAVIENGRHFTTADNELPPLGQAQHSPYCPSDPQDSEHYHAVPQAALDLFYSDVTYIPPLDSQWEKNMMAVLARNGSHLLAPDDGLLTEMLQEIVNETSPNCVGRLHLDFHQTNCTVCDDLDCLLVKHVTDCPEEKPFCVTTVQEHNHSRSIRRRCASQGECDELYRNYTMPNPDCYDVENRMLSGEVTCHFCCQGDNCNRPPFLVPDSSLEYHP
ncbi:hypothetical protein BaRGS_00026151, partial [Batillaria attramentaria]